MFWPLKNPQDSWAAQNSYVRLKKSSGLPMFYCSTMRRREYYLVVPLKY